MSTERKRSKGNGRKVYQQLTLTEIDRGFKGNTNCDNKLTYTNKRTNERSDHWKNGGWQTCERIPGTARNQRFHNTAATPQLTLSSVSLWLNPNSLRLKPQQPQAQTPTASGSNPNSLWLNPKQPLAQLQNSFWLTPMNSLRLLPDYICNRFNILKSSPIIIILQIEQIIHTQ